MDRVRWIWMSLGFACGHAAEVLHPIPQWQAHLVLGITWLLSATIVAAWPKGRNDHAS